MYRRFLNNSDYLGIITQEALQQLTRGNDERFIQAEQSAEMSIVEYLSENYEVVFFLGVRMIKESFDKDEEHHHFNPTRLGTILTLAVATSIDALAVGISFAFTGMNTWQSIIGPICIIGLVSFVFSVLGCLLGVYFGKRVNLRAELWAGIILIGIGVKILFEHLS